MVRGQATRHNLNGPMAQAKFDGDLCRAGAQVEDGAVARPKRKEVRDKDAIDLGMVHGVVVAGFLGGVHHFRFENATQHYFAAEFARTSKSAAWLRIPLSTFFCRCRLCCSSLKIASKSARISTLAAPARSHSRMTSEVAGVRPATRLSQLTTASSGKWQVRGWFQAICVARQPMGTARVKLP